MTKVTFVENWKRSIQPRKQRKYLYNAPLHVRQKLMHAHLSPELRKKYHRRSWQLRAGDKVKVTTGQFKKKEGEVQHIDLKLGRVVVSNVEYFKKDGSKTPIPLRPSNLMIVNLNLDDKKRKQHLESLGKATPVTKKEKK